MLKGFILNGKESFCFWNKHCYCSFKNISKKGISLLILFCIKNYYYVVRHTIVFFLIAKYIIRFTHSFLFKISTVIFVHISYWLTHFGTDKKHNRCHAAKSDFSVVFVGLFQHFYIFFCHIESKNVTYFLKNRNLFLVIISYTYDMSIFIKPK